MESSPKTNENQSSWIWAHIAGVIGLILFWVAASDQTSFEGKLATGIAGGFPFCLPCNCLPPGGFMSPLRGLAYPLHVRELAPPATAHCPVGAEEDEHEVRPRDGG